MAKYERKPRPGFMVDHDLYRKHLMKLAPLKRSLLIDALALYSACEAQSFFEGEEEPKKEAYQRAVKTLKGDSSLEVHFDYLVEFANKGIEIYESQTNGGRPKGGERG